MKQPDGILDFDTPSEFYPLDSPIRLNDGIATFADSTAEPDSRDVAFLRSLPLTEVWYGAATMPIHRLIVTPSTAFRELPTAAEVLTLLRASTFCSEHIRRLDRTDLPFPGYHPHTKNDEIHTDPEEQHFFATDSKLEDELDVEEQARHNTSRDCHTALRDHMLLKRLFYVLVHTKPQDFDGYVSSTYVLLFAVGVSPVSGSLIGVVSHQVCHNLCD